MIKFQKLDQPQTSLQTIKVSSPSNNQFYIIHPSPVEIQTQTQNFFCGSQELLKQIPAYDKGPKFDAKGQILRHTLVGSVQQFMHEKQRRQNTSKKPQVKLQTQLQSDFEAPPMINIMKIKFDFFYNSYDKNNPFNQIIHKINRIYVKQGSCQKISQQSQIQRISIDLIK